MRVERRWLWVSLLILPVLVVGLALMGAAPRSALESEAQAPTTTGVNLPAVAVGEADTAAETAAESDAPAPQPQPDTASTPEPSAEAEAGPVAPAMPAVTVDGNCVNGTVIDNYGVPQAGWTVMAKHDSGSPTFQTTSDAYGRFAFADLGAGTWILEVVILPHWKATTAPIFSVSLTGRPGTCAEVRFKNERLGCLEGFKRDSRDYSGLPGWTITAEKGGLSKSASTDGVGYYKIEDLEGGTWTFSEIVPEGWAPVWPINGQVVRTLMPPYRDGVCERQDFTNRQIARDYGIDVLKKDDNGNPLPNWRIHARPSDHPGPDLVAITGPDGVASFRTGITLGRWTVSEESRAFWKSVSPASTVVTVTTPNQYPSVIFTNEPSTCLEGYKIDENHIGMGGWVIQGQEIGSSEPPVSQTTDANGFFRFDNLSLGRWTFTEVAKEGWTPHTASTFEVDLNRQGSPCTQIRFKNLSEPICVEGYKRDENGVGLSGWTITAQPVDSAGPIKTAITGADGYFRFDGLDARKWRFTETMKLGWTNIEPEQPFQEVDLRSPGPGQCVLINFRNQSPKVCIDAFKKDVHGYVGLPGWEITLQQAEGGPVVTGTTDGTGSVRFDDLTPGWYVLQEVMQSGWAPVSATARKVNVQPNSTGKCAPVTFYNRQSTSAYYPPKTDPPATGACRNWHVVQYGETLSSIAYRYGVTTRQIMSANGLTNPNYIWRGQRLCIP